MLCFGLSTLAGASLLPAFGDGLPGRLWSRCRFAVVYVEACLCPDNGPSAEPSGAFQGVFPEKAAYSSSCGNTRHTHIETCTHTHTHTHNFLETLSSTRQGMFIRIPQFSIHISYSKCFTNEQIKVHRKIKDF